MSSTSSSDSNLSRLNDSELGASGGSAVGCDLLKKGCVPLEESINVLLEKQKNEIMFELRKLKMGDKPVTGTDNKKNVEQFFNNQLHPEPPRPEENRPESVIVEVQGLVQSRPVSSLLQSARFRRSLENAIRGGLNSVSTNSTSTTQVPLRATSSPVQNSASTPRANVPAPPPLPQIQDPMGYSTTPVEVPSLPIATSAPSHPVQFADSSRTLPPLAPEVPAPQRAQSWLERVPLINPSDQAGILTWENVEQAQRESIVMEISELVHSQLVSQSLESEFRSILEARMEDHIASSGTDGNRVQAFIRSLPPAPHIQRNDFSHLGIQPGASGSDNMDNISIISATAAVQVQQTQQQVLMSRELMAVKAQLQEMKNMLKMNFDMQLDIQRAIRQEVAAAVSAATNPVADACRATNPVDAGQCLICLDASADSVLYQCGHLCTCYKCGRELQSRGAHCPVCRAPIKDIIRAYKSAH